MIEGAALPPLVLASASPRRSDLLRAAGFEFSLAPVEIDERPREDELPADYVRRLAAAKADAAECRIPGGVVLGADTAVVVDGRVLGKPQDEPEAAWMLGLLSGRSHEVLTGVALRRDARALVGVERTVVRFFQLSAAEIAWYVASGEPRGKAGGYAIQGLAARFVDRIEGSYSNVVGLPIATVYRMLGELAPSRSSGGS